MRVGRIARRLGVDRNPLRRRSDRTEAWLTMILVLVILVLGPQAALHAAGTVYQNAVRASEWDLTHRFTVKAVLMKDAGQKDPSYSDAYTVETTVPAQWVAPNGSQRSGPVLAPVGQHAGSTVAIWIDQHGVVTGSPVRHHPSADALAAGMLAVFGVLVGAGIVLLLMRRRLDKGRMNDWQTEWMFVEPGWSGRRR